VPVVKPSMESEMGASSGGVGIGVVGKAKTGEGKVMVGSWRKAVG